ncbi:hypothetical protein DEU56DRAFT_752885 [Suillus clintonianus]|uniref:uncharacterized protein n=1 Tax=Suillus clintonianus TaxID=1904413 RepID=UPI001B86738F|nr:uncharacterized protein DEU56DRAFT_752885 [Suillus clintonianus]KAG2149232.1 hypothetical protein DEU56DRAFT_752885 [Suillus clintonianus]
MELMETSGMLSNCCVGTFFILTTNWEEMRLGTISDTAWGDYMTGQKPFLIIPVYGLLLVLVKIMFGVNVELVSWGNKLATSMLVTSISLMGLVVDGPKGAGVVTLKKEVDSILMHTSLSIYFGYITPEIERILCIK